MIKSSTSTKGRFNPTLKRHIERAVSDLNLGDEVLVCWKMSQGTDRWFKAIVTHVDDLKVVLKYDDDGLIEELSKSEHLIYNKIKSATSIREASSVALSSDALDKIMAVNGNENKDELEFMPELDDILKSLVFTTPKEVFEALEKECSIDKKDNKPLNKKHKIAPLN